MRQTRRVCWPGIRSLDENTVLSIVFLRRKNNKQRDFPGNFGPFSTIVDFYLALQHKII
jgi:hypothetical protein